MGKTTRGQKQGGGGGRGRCGSQKPCNWGRHGTVDLRDLTPLAHKCNSLNAPGSGCDRNCSLKGCDKLCPRLSAWNANTPRTQGVALGYAVPALRAEEMTPPRSGGLL